MKIINAVWLNKYYIAAAILFIAGQQLDALPN